LTEEQLDSRSPKPSWIVAAALVIFFVNLLVAGKLLVVEYSARVESAEPSFLSISRHMAAGLPTLGWWPAWYGGIPFRNTYPPLLHAIAAGLAVIARMSVAHAHHIATAIFYAVGPCALFFLALRIWRSLPLAAFSAVLYSLLSPSGSLVSWVRTYVGPWRSWRLTTLVNHGDGPHMTALACIPLALLALDWFLERPNWRRGALCAVTLAAPPLANWLGAFALAISVFVLLLARTDKPGQARFWIWSLAPAIAGYALISPWLPPSTIRLLSVNAQVIGGDYRALAAAMPLHLLVFASLLILLKLALLKTGLSFRWQFPILLAAAFAPLPLLNDWLHYDVLPQPHRYQLEMDLALCLLIAVLCSSLYPRSPRPIRMISAGLVGVFLGALLVTNVRFGWALVQPIDMQNTIEYRTARALEQQNAKARVFAIGTIAYWLNVFSGVPQLAGAVDQALPSRSVGAAIYRLYSGPSEGDPTGKDTLNWLRAYGVDVAVVNSESAPPLYRLFRHPERFARIGKEIWRDSFETAFSIPRRSRSLAHVIPQDAIVPPSDEPAPAHVARYADATEDATILPSSFEWLNDQSATIHARVNPNQVLSIQVSFDPGWRALANGQPQRIERDGLGLMTLRPSCSDCEIRLDFHHSREELVCIVAAWLSAILIVAGFLFGGAFRTLDQLR
jgi:hypothetical protein